RSWTTRPSSTRASAPRGSPPACGGRPAAAPGAPAPASSSPRATPTRTAPGTSSASSPIAPPRPSRRTSQTTTSDPPPSTHSDPIESIALPAGLPVEPVAGCNAGGTHYLCGPAESDRVRPVLYTDSEGQASLIAESLAEALTLAIVLPSWHDALAGVRPPALN